MSRQNTKTSRFIHSVLSEVEIVNTTTNAVLIEIADSALLSRDFKTAGQIAAKLRDPDAARYFANCDPLLLDLETTSKELEAVAADASPYLRARANRQLAGHYLLTGNLERADSLYAKSLSICPADDPVRWWIMRDRGVLLGSAGEQQSAITILRSVCPAAWELRYKYPTFWLDTLNNLAYEFYESGRLDEAESMIARPIASPFLLTNPEWASTAKDIANAKSNQSVKIYVPATYRRKRRKKSNVIEMSTRRARRAIIEAVLDDSSIAGRLIEFVTKKTTSIDIGQVRKEIILDIVDGNVDGPTLLKIHAMVRNSKKKSGS